MTTTLYQQLLTASAYSQCLAHEAAARKAHEADMQRRRSEARQKAWAGRRDPYQGKGLKSALESRLPIGRGNAISLPEIRTLLADIDYAETGLTATLSDLCSANLAFRTGERRAYRYYRKEN